MQFAAVLTYKSPKTNYQGDEDRLEWLIYFIVAVCSCYSQDS